MGTAHAPGSDAGPMPRGLARVLARAALAPVAVRSAYAGESKPPVRPAVPDAPIDAGQAVPSPVPWAAAAQKTPAADSTLRGHAGAPVGTAVLPDPPPGPSMTAVTPPAPDVVGVEEEPTAPPAQARTAQARTPLATQPPPMGSGLDHAEAGPTKSARPDAALTALPGTDSGPPLAVADGLATAEPGLDPPGRGLAVDVPEAVRARIEQQAPQVTPLSRSAPDRADRPDVPAPVPAAPPVVIGRIEVHVDPPAAQADPFAGCRVVAPGLTARRGGGW